MELKTDAGLLRTLTQLVGADAIAISAEERTFLSTDIAASGATAELAVRASDVRTLSTLVRACTERGYIVVPRGGGFSYTGGYTPPSPHSVLIDLRPMRAIVEINTEDMYVIVEVGCTWERLYESLKAQGVRTPFFGPMSGFRSTVGGSLSQGGFFLGSTQYGTAADSVLGLEVVLADGGVIRTGSWGSNAGAAPFLRQYGPDVTGLFLNDNGAMGIKTRAVLRLIPFPPQHAFASFAFEAHGPALQALSSIGRSGYAAECYCWDPYFVRLMATGTSFKQNLRLLRNVARSESSRLRGLGAALSMALSGRRAFQGDTWLVHVALDDVTRAAAEAKLRLIRAMARAAGGREVPASAPRALRSTPFTDFNIPEKRTLRRNLPVHGLVPHSGAAALTEELYAFLAGRAAVMAQGGVSCGVILFAVGAQAVCVEPLLYWEDAMHRLHDRIRERSDLEALSAFTEAPAATRLALQLRDEIKAIFLKHRCAHVQVGRAYPWAQTRDPATLRLLQAFKMTVDPERLMNRGSLGL